MNERGFSRIEMLLAFFLIGLVVSVSVPFFDSMIDRQKSAECQTRLTEIGQAVSVYAREHDSRLPDLIAGRVDRSQAVPVMEEVLRPYVSGPEVFQCPADSRGLYEKSGSSYYWNYFPEFNEAGDKALRVNHFRFTLIRPRTGDSVELVTDKEPYHRQRTTKNSLYLLESPSF